MARQPHYPADASVGQQAAAPADPAKSAPAAAEERQPEAKRSKQLMAGAAIGIGSAAIVAALLYANRRNRSDRG